MTVKSKSELAPLSISLQRTASVGTAVISQLLAPYGVSYAQWRVLVPIFNHGPQSMKQIAELAEITPSAASRLVDRMVRSGMLVRQVDPNDRRGTVVSVDETYEPIWGLASIVQKAEAILLADLSREEANNLHKLSRKIQRTARAWLAAPDDRSDN